MRLLKGILEEELHNSKRMKKSYEHELAKLPKGSLVSKKIHSKNYFYLVFRDKNGKVRTLYKGAVSPEEKKMFEEAKKLRAKYRSLRSELRKEIQLLERVLRAREIRSVS